MSKPRSDRDACPHGDREQLHAFLDGELPADSQATLDAHRQQCASCAAALQEMAELDRLLSAARAQPAPLSPTASRALLERALAEAGARRGGPRRGRLALAWGLAAALVALASGIARDGWRPAAVARHQGGLGPQVASVPGAGLHLLAPAGPHPLAPSPKGWGRGNEVRRASRLRAPLPKRRRQRAPLPQFLGEGPGVGAFGDQGMRAERRRVGPRRVVAAAPASQPAQAGFVRTDRGFNPGRRRDARPRRGVPTQYQLAEMPGHGDTGTAALPQNDPTHAGEPFTPPNPAGGLAYAVAETGAMAAAEPAPPQTAAPTPAAPPAAPPRPQLLVLVTSEPAPSPLAVTEAPENAPSYARAMALRPDANGGAIWMQATASDDGSGTKMALVMLGSSAGSWEGDN